MKVWLGLDAKSTLEFMTHDQLYDPKVVCALFDEMARTYGIVNLVSSFGFTRRWRRQCARSITVKRGSIILDLMTGMGELCPDLNQQLDGHGQIIALDISPIMCEHARKRAIKESTRYRVVEANALDCPLSDDSVDYVFSSFGLKTFNHDQLHQLASEVNRVLRPGGEFAFLEISVPSNRILRTPYLAYLNHLIPIIGRILMGNPDNYRLLGIYTSAFGNCNLIADIFTSASLQTKTHSYFFGCATGITGRKPIGE